MCESDIDILVCDLLLTAEDASRFGLHKSSLEEVFQQSDVIGLHTPKLDTTIGMIDKRILNLMKTNSVLINTARGAIISENDLINFLRHWQDVYAILDVTGPEPPTADSVLIRYGKCIIVSPYSRFYGTRMQKARPVYGGRTPKICSWHGTTLAGESGAPCLLHIIADSSRAQP